MNEANTSFGMPRTPAEEIEALKTALASANAKLLAAGMDLSAPDGEGTGPIDSQGFPKDYVRVVIFPGQNAQDLSYVPLAIGGYAVKVTRGKEVILPRVFVEVLEHAVEEITTQAEGGLITRPSLRFPFQVRGPASEDEYKAFQAQMRAQAAPAAPRA